MHGEWKKSELTFVGRVREIKMSIIHSTHLQHNAELMELTQHHLGIILVDNVRITGTSSSASFTFTCRRGSSRLGKDVHITQASITDQVIRIHPLQTLVSRTRRTAVLPNVWSNERIDLMDRVQLVMVKTIGNCIAVSLGPGKMLEYDDRAIFIAKRDLGIM